MNQFEVNFYSFDENKLQGNDFCEMCEDLIRLEKPGLNCQVLGSKFKTSAALYTAL